MENLLCDPKVEKLLEEVDDEAALQAQEEGCQRCEGGRLHRADYDRKPRGGPHHWDKRHSFCCAEEGCRKRKTPASVRFLGRKVYVGVVVVLVSAMAHGINQSRAERLREQLGMDKRTLQRWRQWWAEEFVSSDFWKAQRGRFMPSVEEGRMPLCLVEAFDAGSGEGVVRLLRFLSPITTGYWRWRAM
jgi:hypothetical protein